MHFNIFNLSYHPYWLQCIDVICWLLYSFSCALKKSTCSNYLELNLVNSSNYEIKLNKCTFPLIIGLNQMLIRTNISFNISACFKIGDTLIYMNILTRVNANYLHKKQNIRKHFELVNIWRKSKCTSSNYMELSLINVHTMQYL